MKVRDLTLDFETVFTSDYSLGKLTEEEYIRHPKFGVHMAGLCLDDEEPFVVHGDDVGPALDEIDWSSVKLICHNASFDAGILYERFGHTPRWITCTKALSMICYPRAVMRYSLNNMSSLLGLGRKGKDLYLSKGYETAGCLPALVKRRMAAYCAQDVALTRALYHRLNERLDWMAKMSGVDPRQLRRIEGLCLDDGLRATTEAVLDLNLDLLRPIAEEERQRRKPWLKDNETFAEELRKLGIDPPTKKGANGRTFAFAKKDRGMIQLANSPNEEVRQLVEDRLDATGGSEHKRATRFMQIGSRGALPVALEPGAAHTGRDGGGDRQKINLQNLGRGSDLRRAIQAPAGHLLVACDLDQIEARVFAGLVGEEWMLKAFHEGRDIYREFASEHLMEDTAPADIPNKVRQLAKICYLGLQYGMGGKTFHYNCMANGFPDMDDERAYEIMGAFLRGHKKFKKFQRFAETLPERIARAPEDESIKCTEVAGGMLRLSRDHIHLPSGRALAYPNLRNIAKRGRRPFWVWGSKGEKFAGKVYMQVLVENIIQSLARDALWTQMARIRPRLPEGARLVHRIHDEAVYVTREKDADEVKELVTEEMSRSPSWLPQGILGAEAGVAKNWLDAK